MTDRIQKGGLRVARCLAELVDNEIAPGTGIEPDQFWTSFESIINDLAPKNRALLARRDELQSQIDEWHRARRGQDLDPAGYKAFLEEIGYLEPEGGDFQITTPEVDPEIAEVAGPQLVVPVMNARYALNAANARWGSVYDALYGSDIIDEDGGAEAGTKYNPVRGAKVVAFVAGFLDSAVPLEKGSHVDAQRYRIEESNGTKTLAVELGDGSNAGLKSPGKFAGYNGGSDEPSAILLRNHGMHIEIQIDRGHPVGKDHPAGVKDVVLEAAMTTIQDCEDSVTAVDAEDKTEVYRNWLGLMKGTLEATFPKGGKALTRKLNPDRTYIAPDGSGLVLHGRSLLLNRNVGHLMTTDAVLDKDGNEIPEGFLDAMITSFAALHDLKGNSTVTNSRTGHIYIVKPKMHGPAEAAFADEVTAASNRRSIFRPTRSPSASWMKNAGPPSTSRNASGPPGAA